jgi:hypothetical protein
MMSATVTEVERQSDTIEETEALAVTMSIHLDADDTVDVFFDKAADIIDRTYGLDDHTLMRSTVFKSDEQDDGHVVINCDAIVRQPTVGRILYGDAVNLRFHDRDVESLYEGDIPTIEELFLDDRVVDIVDDAARRIYGDEAETLI